MAAGGGGACPQAGAKPSSSQSSKVFLIAAKYTDAQLFTLLAPFDETKHVQASNVFLNVSAPVCSGAGKALLFADENERVDVAKFVAPPKRIFCDETFAVKLGQYLLGGHFIGPGFAHLLGIEGQHFGRPAAAADNQLQGMVA